MTSVLVDARLPWGSGIGRYVQNVVPAVARALPDVQFTLLHGDHSRVLANELLGGLANVRLVDPAIEPFSMKEQVQGPRVMAGYDLVWFTNYWVPLGFRGRFVAVVFDLLHLEPRLFPASRVKRALSWLTFRHLARRASLLFFISYFSQNEFERRFRSRAVHVMSSLGVDHVGKKKPVAEPEETVFAKQPQLLLVAAAKAHKNFAMALDAFAAAHIPDHWRLTIITPPDLLRSSIDVDALAAADPRIRLKRGVDDDELAELYRASAIVLMPSLYEGFGLPLAEGLLAGATCISSTAPALVELGKGSPARFVDPLDRAAWTAAIEQECARFDAGEVPNRERQAGIDHAAKVSWAPVIEKTIEHITATLGATTKNGMK